MLGAMDFAQTGLAFAAWLNALVSDCLRGETKGSQIQGKMGIEVAGLGGRNEHQFEPGCREICMQRRLGKA